MLFKWTQSRGTKTARGWRRRYQRETASGRIVDPYALLAVTSEKGGTKEAHRHQKKKRGSSSFYGAILAAPASFHGGLHPIQAWSGDCEKIRPKMGFSWTSHPCLWSKRHAKITFGRSNTGKNVLNHSKKKHISCIKVRLSLVMSRDWRITVKPFSDWLRNWLRRFSRI